MNTFVTLTETLPHYGVEEKLSIPTYMTRKAKLHPLRCIERTERVTLNAFHTTLMAI